MEGLSRSEVFQQFYSKLVKALPMDDAFFIAELVTHNLLPGNIQDHVRAQPTSADKALYFLDHVIRPSVSNDTGSSFDELLDVMEDSDYHVNELAKQIRSNLREGCKGQCTSEPARKKWKPNPIDIYRLKPRYLRLLPTSKTDWPKHTVTQYIRLALIEKEDVTLGGNHLNEVTKLTLQGDIDSILKKKKPLHDLRDILFYQNKPCPRLILIMGGPGIGKTTLANEICFKWARNEFLTEDFDAIILIPMRSVQQRSFRKVLKEHVGKQHYQQLMDSAGNRCLIILEGFDEMALSRRQSDPFLERLIKDYNTVLEEATVIITSRPHACEDLNAHRKIEIVGFGKHEIKEFVEKSFPNEHQSVEFLQQLDEYPHLHSLCYVPMNLVMIVDIFRCSEKKLPGTLTELYQIFIVMTLQRQVETKAFGLSPVVKATDSEKELCRMLKGIRKEMVEIVLQLCKLAYRGLFDWYDKLKQRFTRDSLRKAKDPRIIFTESDLSQCDIQVTPVFDGFGLLKAARIHQLPTDTNTYSFAHLTIQEFLCAVYITLLSQQEQFHLLEENFQEYPNVFTFVCSLAEVGSNEISRFIYSKLQKRSCLDVITAVRCINESKWLQDIPAPSLSPFALDFTSKGLHISPYDCFGISRHVLSCHPVSCLIMKHCRIGDKGIKLLVRHYPYENTTGQLLEELDLLDNEITIEGLKDVVEIMRTSVTTLKVFNIGNNDIGDKGIAMILDTLKANQSLTHLEVEECGFLVEGASYISQLLNVTHTLQVLHISGNNIGDEGMEMISQALQRNTQLSITELWVAQCGLGVKGAVSISEIMMVSPSLQKLRVGYNSISDDGIDAIAKELGKCKITDLNVTKCGITLVGTRSLASVLSSNQTIRVLWLQDNPITVEGAQLIEVAIRNTKCYYVGIDIEYKMKEKKLEESSQQQKVATDTRDDNSSQSNRISEQLPMSGVIPPASMKISVSNQSGDEDDSEVTANASADKRSP